MREYETEIRTGDGAMDTFICHPEEGGPFPAVIIYMDAPGIREELRDMARRIGTVGYYVLLPNLYYRNGREGGYGFDLGRLRSDDGEREMMFQVMRTLTNGRVVVLGPTGRNFAAGMSGGIAYVLDEDGVFSSLCNQEMADLEQVVEAEDIHVLRGLIQKHRHYTNSKNAERILANWSEMLPKFVKVYPRDYRRVMDARKRAELEPMTSG